MQVALDHLSGTKQLLEFSFKRCRQLRIMALVARYLPVTERLERLALTGSAIQVIPCRRIISLANYALPALSFRIALSRR